MLHARNVRPPVAGAKLVSIDESSVKNVPGFVKVVSKGNYVAVVCEREEQAIQAARQLKVNWDKPATAAFPSSENLYGFMRTAKPTSSTPPSVIGNPDAAMMTAAKVVEAEYEVPFQGHTSIGPAHAMADPSNNQLTIYSNDMKSYGMREGVAQFLQMPKDRIRVVWMEGPQAYGRTAADDAGFEAAYLANELGTAGSRPVDAQRGDRVGHQGSGVRREGARRSGCAGQSRCVRLRRTRRRLRSPRLQRARHGAHCAADGDQTARRPIAAAPRSRPRCMRSPTVV